MDTNKVIRAITQSVIVIVIA